MDDELASMRGTSDISGEEVKFLDRPSMRKQTDSPGPIFRRKPERLGSPGPAKRSEDQAASSAKPSTPQKKSIIIIAYFIFLLFLMLVNVTIGTQGAYY